MGNLQTYNGAVAWRGPEVAASSDWSHRFTPSEVAALAAAADRASEILVMLSARLHAQQETGSDYFVGDTFTATDLYWACFSQLVAPLDASVNRMPGLIRDLYDVEGTAMAAAVDPILLAHRARVYEKHLSLPLDF